MVSFALLFLHDSKIFLLLMASTLCFLRTLGFLSKGLQFFASLPFKVTTEACKLLSFRGSMHATSVVSVPSGLSQVPNGGDDGGETHALPLPWDKEDLALDTAESLSESISILLTTAGLDLLDELVIGFSVLSFELRLLVLTDGCFPVGSGLLGALILVTD